MRKEQFLHVLQHQAEQKKWAQKSAIWAAPAVSEVYDKHMIKDEEQQRPGGLKWSVSHLVEPAGEGHHIGS